MAHFGPNLGPPFQTRSQKSGFEKCPRFLPTNSAKIGHVFAVPQKSLTPFLRLFEGFGLFKSVDSASLAPQDPI